MRATPQIDWAGIAKAEANDPAAAAFGRATRRKRMMMMFGVLGLLIATPFLIVMYLRHQEQAEIDARRLPDPVDGCQEGRERLPFPLSVLRLVGVVLDA